MKINMKINMGTFDKLLSNVLILSLLAISCRTSSTKADSHIITFNLNKLPKISEVKLSDLGFTDIEYILLETNDQSMVPMINNVLFGDNYFLTLFFTNILMYRYDGKFVTKIGTEGRGPEEFTVVHDVDINRNNQKIYLADGWQKKFYVYSETGGFVNTFRTYIQGDISFRFTEDGILCYNKNSLGNVENSYTLIDTSGKIIKNFPNKYLWNLRQKNTVIFNENLFYRFNNKLYKKEIYSDTIFIFEHSYFKPHLIIKHGDKLLTTKARSEYDPRILSEKFISQKNLFEFGDYIYYEFTYDSKRNEGITFKGFIGSKKDNTQFLINSENGIVNDLDGGPGFWPKTIKDDRTVVSWVEALKLKKYIDSDLFKNSTPKYPEKKKELEKLANSLKESDNPVLMIVRLKE